MTVNIVPVAVGLQATVTLADMGLVGQAKGAESAGVMGVSFGGKCAGLLGGSSCGAYGGAGGGSGHQPPANVGVWGESGSGNGVYGASANWNGVQGDSWSAAHCGVAGVNYSGGTGVYGESSGNAGHFIGNVTITGNLTNGGDASVAGNLTVAKDILLTGADCAEDFDVSGLTEDPGTVVVITETGSLEACGAAYDRKVAGVISGAGGLRPGVVLDRQQSKKPRMAVALAGKVYVKADAKYGRIALGDLLTTSPTQGHAMKATDAAKAFGAVMGKALQPLDSGCGLIAMLVALQ